MRNTQQDLLHQLDALDIPEAPLSAGEMDRLTRAVMGRVDASHTPEAESSHETEKVPAVHVVRHRALTFGIAAAVVENREMLVYNEQQTFIPYAKTEHGAGNTVSPPFDFGRMFCYELSPVCQADPASD